MKTFLPIALLIATVFAACKSDPQKDLNVKKDFVLMDTTKIYPNGSLSDTGMVTRNTVVAPPVVTAPVIREKQLTTRKATNTKPAVNNNPSQTNNNSSNSNTSTNNTKNTTTPPATGVGNTGATAAKGGSKGDTVATVPPVAKKKEGWSDAAKGATIGGVGGAAAGAIIGKNAKGAVIGGILGAAGGYIFGRKKDRQSGRVDTSKH